MRYFILALLLSIATPTWSAPTLVVYDMSRDKYVTQNNADAVISIASITKLATVIVVLEARQDLTQILKTRGRERSSRISSGMLLSRLDLIELTLVTSDNLAANTLIENYPGGKSAGLAAMNALAQRLNLKATRYVDASGLNSANTSTAQDLIKILNHASRHEIIRQFSQQDALDITVTKRSKKKTWVEHIRGLATNPYLRSPQTFDVVVAKTGYTTAAGWCLAMLIEIDGQRFSVVSTGNASKDQRKAVLDQAIEKLTNGQFTADIRDDFSDYVY